MALKTTKGSNKIRLATADGKQPRIVTKKARQRIYTLTLFGLFVKDIEKKRMKFTVHSYLCG